MLNFIDAINTVLEEQDKTTKNLFDDRIISENTFYKYKNRYPSLKTLINLLNYLKVSIDYLFEFKDENIFVPYKYNSLAFYRNLTTLLGSKKISGRQFCSDLHFSRDNINRWKNGTQPSIQTLIEIANYFNCTIDELLMP